MARAKGFIEAGNEYKAQIAASNPIITTKAPAIWFQEIADKLQLDMALSELTLEYNLSLVDDEEPMSEKEMAEIMEVSEVGQSCWDCEFCAGSDIDKDGNEIPGKVLCCWVRTCDPIIPHSVEQEAAENCQVFNPKGSEEPAFASGDYGRAFVQAEQEAMAKPRYSEWDMMLKDDEIALLKQRIDYLEKHINTLRAQGYGINWKAIREAMENENRSNRMGG